MTISEQIRLLLFGPENCATCVHGIVVPRGAEKVMGPLGHELHSSPNGCGWICDGTAGWNIAADDAMKAGCCVSYERKAKEKPDA